MPELLGVDWGTSSFRAYLLEQNGDIAGVIRSDTGIMAIANGDFSDVLEEELARLGSSPRENVIIASGMITSKNGWYETPYIECPASTSDLGKNLCRLRSDRFPHLWFVPGVRQREPEPDIMRGEETQLAGLALSGPRTVLLPGTHSKWVKMERDTITCFKTFMTGELFAAVMQKTIMKIYDGTAWSSESFLQGVATGYNSYGRGASILTSLFQVRVKDIFHLTQPEGNRSFISGLLIGHEIGEAQQLGFMGKQPVLVGGDRKLVGLYQQALAECGTDSETVERDIAAKGLHRIAQSRNLI